MDGTGLPKKLIICGVPFEVRYLENIEKEDDREIYGVTYKHQRLIEINLSAHETDAQVKSTLLHECLHAILHVTGQSEQLSYKQEEGIVIALECGLAGIVYQLEGGKRNAKKKKA